MAVYKPIPEVLRTEVGRILALITTGNGYNYTLRKVYPMYVDAGDAKKDDYPYACYFVHPEEELRASFSTVDELYTVQITAFVDLRKSDTVDMATKVSRVWGDIKKAITAQRTTAFTNIATGGAGAKLIDWKLGGAVQVASYKGPYGYADGQLLVTVQRPRGEA